LSITKSLFRFWFLVGEWLTADIKSSELVNITIADDAMEKTENHFETSTDKTSHHVRNSAVRPVKSLLGYKNQTRCPVSNNHRTVSRPAFTSQ